MTQCGNREWVSLIECISMDGRVLKPWIIFKGKVQQKAWYEVLKEGHIAVSENGWTDNELGLAWIRKCFDPETKICQKGEYRMLLIDDHASHITTQVIDYCVSQKIILLCLLTHTTHLLQSLDVEVFASLATAYKAHVQRVTRLEISYSIDKTNFLKLYQPGRSAGRHVDREQDQAASVAALARRIVVKVSNQCLQHPSLPARASLWPPLFRNGVKSSCHQS